MATQTPYLPPGSPATVAAGVVVNPTNMQATDGSVAPNSTGRMGELLASELRGKYGTMGSRGGVFMAGASTAATSIAINTTTSSSTFVFNNPAGSGKMAEFVRFTMGFLAAGPATANQVGWNIVNTGTNAISAITKIPDPISAGGHPANLIGPAPSCSVCSAATFASAQTIAANWGYQMFTFPATYLTTAAVQTIPMVYNFDGDLLVPPGWAMCLVASTAWAANTVVPQLSWLEHNL